MISKPLLKFLIVCFWAGIALIIIQLFVLFKVFEQFPVLTEPHFLIQGTIFILSTLWFILFFYSIYFFYKYDRYSSAGVFLFFFHFIYALVYFYRVIWHQKRVLVGSYESEPVLGNTIHLETDDTEDIDYEEDEQIESKAPPST